MDAKKLVDDFNRWKPDEKRWAIQDRTSPRAGYLQLSCDGRRVCDFFPFSKGADEAWVREQAQRIADAMNTETR